MKTVNSISGGKTSSYMAMHYKADYDVFALVCIDDKKCSPKDSGIIKSVSDKLGKEFIATAEDDKTLVAIFDLEQKIGRPITWLSGVSFDLLIKKRKALPNKQWRFCTTEMKMRPIFDWWYSEIKEKVDMRIGFRYDESERKDKVTNIFKGIIGKRGTKNKWEEIEWRLSSFPLIDNKIIHPRVYEWSKKSGIDFPEDSNCVGCFWKNSQQLRKNWETNTSKMQWFADQEKTSTFKDGISYSQIKNIGIQLDFIYGGGAGCQEEYCTP